MKHEKKNSSGVKGVTWNDTSREWHVNKSINGSMMFFGSFPEDQIALAIDCRHEANGINDVDGVKMLRAKYSELKKQIKEGLVYQPRFDIPQVEHSVNVPQQPGTSGLHPSLAQLLDNAQKADAHAAKLEGLAIQAEIMADNAMREAIQAWDDYQLELQRVAGNSPSFKRSKLGATMNGAA